MKTTINKTEIENKIKESGYAIKYKNQHCVTAYKNGVFVVSACSNGISSPIQNLAKYLNIKL